MAKYSALKMCAMQGAHYLCIPHLCGRWRTVRRRASTPWVCTNKEIAPKRIGCNVGLYAAA